MITKNALVKALFIFMTIVLGMGVLFAITPSAYGAEQTSVNNKAQTRYDEIEPDYYYVTFNDWDGTELKVIRVPKFYDAIPPTKPSREGYSFSGWDKDYTNVQSNIIVTAKYVSNESAKGSPLGLYVWLGIVALWITAFVFIVIREKKPLLPKEKAKESKVLDQSGH